MSQDSFAELVFVLMIGMTAVIVLFVGSMVIFSVIRRSFRKDLNGVKSYCDTKIDEVTGLMNETNRHTSELSKLVKELNSNLKTNEP